MRCISVPAGAPVLTPCGPPSGAQEALPADRGDSGVMTFLPGEAGIVYERDPGDGRDVVPVEGN